MSMRYKWGLPLTAFVLVTCLSFDGAHAQLIGGTSGAPNAGYDPSSVPMSPRAVAIAQDPYAGVSFNICMAKANAVAQQTTMPDINSITADNAISQGSGLLLGGLGGAIGSSIGGGSAGQGFMNGALGNNGCDSALPQPKFTASCDSFKTGDKFNPGRLDAAVAELSAASQKADCKAKNATRAESVLDCFNDEFQNLKDSMAELKKDFDANIKGMGDYEQQVNGEIQKEEQKQETLGGKITSLSQTKAEVEGVLAKINGAVDAKSPNGGTISGLSIIVNDQAKLIKNFETHKKQAKANRTGACLAGTGASTSGIRNCPTAGGDLLPPKECVLSVYRDSIALQLSGGSTRVSPADRKKAEFAKTNFQNRLNQMMNDFQGGQPRTGSAEDFIARHGSELNSFGVAGQQMITELNNCAQEVQADIEKELASPESGLGSEAEGIKQTAQTVASDMGAMINTLDTTIRNAGKEVYGQELNEMVNGFGCTTASVSANSGEVGSQPVALQQQLKCVQGLNANLSAMLNGTPPPGAKSAIQVPLNVPGQDGAPARCKGLRDCLDKAGKLKTESEQRKKNLSGEGVFKDSRCPAGCPGLKKFHKDSNKQIQAALQQSADLFKRRVMIAKAQFGQVKALLGGVDLTLPNKAAKGVKLNDFCDKTADAICEMPADFADQMAGLAGVPDIGPEVFEGKKTEATAKKAEYAGKQTEFKNSANELVALRSTCTKAEADKKSTKGLAKVSGSFQDALGKCKVQAARSDAAAVDGLVDRISALSSDLTKVCATSDDTDGCSKLRTNISDGGSECMQVLDTQLAKAAGDYKACLRAADTIGTGAAGADRASVMSDRDAAKRNCEDLKPGNKASAN